MNPEHVYRDALRAILANASDEEPDVEDYDDTESASIKGVECGLWEAAQIAKAALDKFCATCGGHERDDYHGGHCKLDVCDYHHPYKPGGTK